MFDDLDDLLNDEPVAKPTNNRPKTSYANTTKAKKDDDEFDWDPPAKSQYTFGSEKKGTGQLGAASAKKSENTYASFGGSKKQEKKDDDDWEGWGLDDNKSAGVGLGKTGFSGGQQSNKKDEGGRSSTGSNYAGFGLLGKTKPSKKKDDDDDLDNILGYIEEKKGIEQPPKVQEKRPHTSDARVKKGNDPWAKETFDELDDLDDGKSKNSQGANAQLLEKRRALFGVGGGANTASNTQPSQQQRNTTFNPPPQLTNLNLNYQNSKSLNREDDDEQDNYQLGASQGSAIEVIETGAFSRQGTMKRMPQTASNKSTQDKGGITSGRPPTGGQLSGLQQPYMQQQQFHTIDRLQTSPMGMQTHSNNFSLPPTQGRPQTGNFGKPPKHIGGGSGMQYDQPEDDNILDLLDDNKNRSHKGSMASAGGGVNYQMGSIDHDEDEDEGGSYSEDYEEGGDDDSDEGGFYVPTALSRAGGSTQDVTKPKKKSAKKKKQNKQQQPIVQGVSMTKSIGGGSVFGDKNLANLNNSARGAYTIASDADQQQPSMLMQQNHSTFGGTIPQQQSAYQGIANISQTSQPIIQQPLDEQSLVQRQIDDERQRIKLMEDRNRKQIDDLREEHKRNMKQLDEKQTVKIQLYNDEKRKLIEDMNKTIELEKEKLSNLHKIDVDNRELQYKRNLDNQKKLYEDQHDSLKQSLQQKVQMNVFGEEISHSSGNINNLVQKLSAQQEGELRRREEDLKHREEVLQERKKGLAERKSNAQQRRRKLQLELEDLQQRQHESKLDFEREKSEIIQDIDKIELQHQQTIRESRNRAIELEVETRKTKSEIERVVQGIKDQEKQYEERLVELQQEKKQLQSTREDLKREIESSERELKQKLREIRDQEDEIEEEERAFEDKERQFDSENRAIKDENERMQEQLDKYCIEREQFDREAMKVKEQGERDQIDSEKIGYFKANKERLREELQQLRMELEHERESIREDRIKLSLFKNELKTRQKTIENIRYEFIKNSQDSQHKFLDDAREVGFYKLQRHAGGPTFYPISPPAFEQRKENISPNGRAVNRSVSQQQQQRYQGNVSTTEQYIPRFNYNDYMKGLQTKLQSQAPISSTIVGTDFQVYLMRERENYLKSLHEFDADQPLIHSISHFRNSHHRQEGGDDASFNLGSLQNSQYDKKKQTVLLNSQLGKSSGNSLHFISKNFSNSPVEEVEQNKEESRLYNL